MLYQLGAGFMLKRYISKVYLRPMQQLPFHPTLKPWAICWLQLHLLSVAAYGKKLSRVTIITTPPSVLHHAAILS